MLLKKIYKIYVCLDYLNYIESVLNPDIKIVEEKQQIDKITDYKIFNYKIIVLMNKQIPFNYSF